MRIALCALIPKRTLASSPLRSSENLLFKPFRGFVPGSEPARINRLWAPVLSSIRDFAIDTISLSGRILLGDSTASHGGIFADGWWADIDYRSDRATDEWRVAVLNSNAYGPMAFDGHCSGRQRGNRRRRGASEQTCLCRHGRQDRRRRVRLVNSGNVFVHPACECRASTRSAQGGIEYSIRRSATQF